MNLHHINDYFTVRLPDAARVRINVAYKSHEERVRKRTVKCVKNCKSNQFFTIVPSTTCTWGYDVDSRCEDSVMLPVTALHGRNHPWY